MTSNMENSEGSIDLMAGSNTEMFPGDKYVQRRSSTKARKEKKKKKKDKKENGNSSSKIRNASSDQRLAAAAASWTSPPPTTDYYDNPNDNALSYAESKYVKKPEVTPELQEQATLLTSSEDYLDPDDPLVMMQGGGGLGLNDEFEDELTEQEMREEKMRNLNRFGDTALSPFEKRLRTCKVYLIPMCLAMLFCIGVAATILYVTEFGKTKESSSSPSSSSSSYSKMAQAVPAPPSNLDITCQKMDDGNNNDPSFDISEDCKKACEKAECCWNPAGAYVCTDETKSLCPAYQEPCSELARLDAEFETVDGLEEMIVQPMPAYLKTSCYHPDASSSSVTEEEVSSDCEVGCSQAECCWKTTTSFFCTDETEQYCADYKETCSFLNNKAPFPVAQPDLGAFCNPNDLDEQVCRDMCEEASCCWDTSVPSCVDQYGTSCRDYTLSCGVLLNNQNGSSSNSNNNNGNNAPFPPSSQHLGSICDPRTLDVTACESECSHARCCWDSSVATCLDKYGEACHDYSLACSILEQSGTTGSNSDTSSAAPFPSAPQTLGDVCNPRDMDVVACGEACSKARCCWDNSISSCISQYGSECHDYALACSILNEDPASGSSANAPFPPAPDGLGVFCNPSELEEVSLHICQDKCNQAKCCWDDDVTSCVHQYGSDCHDYALACGILNDLKTASGNDNDIGASNAPAPTEEIPDAPSDLATRCARDNIIGGTNSGEALIQCEEDCLKASCCWQPNVESCASYNPVCDDYKGPCQIFVALFEVPEGSPAPSKTTAPAKQQLDNVLEPSPDMQEFCKKENLKLSVNNGQYIIKCEEECLKGACCWKESDPFTCPNAPQCAAYMEPCGTNLLEALDNLMPGASSSGTGSSGSGTTAPPAAPFDLNLRCSQNHLSNSPDKVDLCSIPCEKAACCWNEGEVESCKDQYPSICPSYSPCTILTSFDTSGSGSSSSTSGGNLPVESPPQDLSTICAQNAISDLAGMQKCKQACLKADCCWLDPSNSNSCSAATDCQTYIAECEALRQQLQITSGAFYDAIDNACNTNDPDFLPANCDRVCEAGACCLDDSCNAGFNCDPYRPCSNNQSRRNMLRHR